VVLREAALRWLRNFSLWVFVLGIFINSALT